MSDSKSVDEVELVMAIIIYEGITDTSWLSYYNVSYRDNWILMLAARVGNFPLVQILFEPEKADYVSLEAGLFEHWDIFDFVARKVSIDKAIRMASVSPQAFECVAAVHNSITIEMVRVGAIDICYKRGFNRETLDYFIGEGTTEPIEASIHLGERVRRRYHSSVLETLQYLLNKYPNPDWYHWDSAEYIVSEGRFDTPELARAFKALLIRAGCRP